ncbi:MAG: TIGR02450 family Trp-rich protein [Gammaproteobacteria bacterium]|nr:TIGR02450 family Trp-rich protein [Gammaproteobacteria bacterium]MCP4088382.1 TIGR02450 family Trp-rich protein [Gammaproteobacteria bacterium]MCP4275079.1 TIGR02450 family Trp-rich protein [Gammaproteobacteria bacterium]MCP4830954.1 TIGR02450 family Trp-rich protein [Gammaproteobacteria bacterium]MCP4927525.1 TIGR02450 family Trp-rich protein [Gammaproteobacteria bacterium]
MNHLSSKKLLHTKWTARLPINKEKHFLVTAVHCDEEGNPQAVTLEAVYSQRDRQLDWRELKDVQRWQTGWQ